MFRREPIRFRVTTATALLKLGREAALEKIARLCLENAGALREAVEYCRGRGIGAFRVTSRILPVKTHARAGYAVSELPGARSIVRAFRAAGDAARRNNIRLSFHPDQFVVLNAPDPEVVRRTFADLEYHAEAAGWIGADVITIHAGGGYGDKPAALRRLRKNLALLPDAVRRRLTLENDDRTFTPADLLPLCRAENIPFVYDVHHHRCLPDGTGVMEATDRALATWNREPLFHVSSPLNGWDGSSPCRHGDYIDIRDFPECWKPLDITVDVEAKAKEKAVRTLRRRLS